MPKVVRFHETGGPDVLKIESVATPQPGQGEVRIKVAAIGLNRAECMFRAGQYLEAPKLPATNGYEAAGVVDAVGPGVSGLNVGDKVSTIPAFGLTQYGMYGEEVLAPAHAVAAYPANLTPEQGTAIWMQYITAWTGLIELGKLEAGQAALITAGSSSVALAAMQIAKAAGATAILTTRKPDKKQQILSAGADHVIVTEQEDLAKRVAEITGAKGANVILDPVSGPYVETLAQAAAQNAKLFVYGLLDPRPTPFPLFASFQKGIWMRAFTLFEVTPNPAALARAKQYIQQGLASGALKPIIDTRKFTLDQMPEAHRYMESNQQFGKIVVNVP
jgi:NADPH:quinone reductase